MRPVTALLLLWLMGLVSTALPTPVPFIAGADVSLVPFFEARGIVYRENGQAQDPLAILSRHGVNCARLRLFTSSDTQAQADPYNYINNLAYTLPLAVRVKNAGLRLWLDFHYSDTWADPAHQSKPAAWAALDFPHLVQQLHDYTSNCIAAFSAAGAMPDYVQLGNEISSGLLWPDGEVGGAYDTPAQWAQLGQLLNAAVQGVRDASGAQMPKLVIHIDRGGDWTGTQWFFDNLSRQSVPFDIIGESYYPFWHGTLGDLAHCLTNAAVRYAKPLLIAETAFPWTNSYWTTNLDALAPSVVGQAQFVAALAPVLEGLPLGCSAGLCWWGAEYQRANGVNEAGFNTTSLFDSGGNVLPAADCLGQLGSPLRLRGTRGAGLVTLEWPLSGAGCGLVSTTWLGPAAQWVAVTNQPQNTLTGFSLTLPVWTTTNHYYRLQRN